jgi:hypothetical protein
VPDDAPGGDGGWGVDAKPEVKVNWDTSRADRLKRERPPHLSLGGVGGGGNVAPSVPVASTGAGQSGGWGTDTQTGAWGTDDQTGAWGKAPAVPYGTYTIAKRPTDINAASSQSGAWGTAPTAAYGAPADTNTGSGSDSWGTAPTASYGAYGASQKPETNRLHSLVSRDPDTVSILLAPRVLE